MKPIVLTPTHVFVNFSSFKPEQWLKDGINSACAFIEGARRLAQSSSYVAGGIGGGVEPQVGCLIGWAMLPIETARILACVCGELGDPFDPGHLRCWSYKLFGIPVTQMRDARSALDAIVCHRERYKLGRDRRPQYERTRRLELLRLLGIKRCGRNGTATRIYSEPPRWDGFGQAPYAFVDVPDDRRQLITARVNDWRQLSHILGGDEAHRIAFGAPGGHLSLSRI